MVISYGKYFSPSHNIPLEKLLKISSINHYTKQLNEYIPLTSYEKPNESFKITFTALKQKLEPFKNLSGDIYLFPMTDTFQIQMCYIDKEKGICLQIPIENRKQATTYKKHIKFIESTFTYPQKVNAAPNNLKIFTYYSWLNAVKENLEKETQLQFIKSFTNHLYNLNKFQEKESEPSTSIRNKLYTDIFKTLSTWKTHITPYIISILNKKKVQIVNDKISVYGISFFDTASDYQENSKAFFSTLFTRNYTWYLNKNDALLDNTQIHYAIRIRKSYVDINDILWIDIVGGIFCIYSNKCISERRGVKFEDS